MALNDFLPFCPSDTGTNLLSQSDYSLATDRSIGNQPGIASSKLVNRATRQAAWVASQLAQFMATTTGSDVLDNGDSATFQALLKQCLSPGNFNPNVQKFLSAGSSGTYGVSYYFTVISANATAGAVYTNNGHTFVVVNTIAASTTLLCTSGGLPTTSGTLTKSSGTGDATISFSVAKAPTYIRVRMAGAGGGGAGNGPGSTAGTDGTSTTFGSSLLTANGGVGSGAGAVAGGLGGTVTVSSPAISIIAQPGGKGGGLSGVVAANSPRGGDNPFGGAGAESAGGISLGTGINGVPNTGGGASGGGGGGTIGPASSAGAGGYIEAIINNPSATYAYAIGTGGTHGAAGSAGNDGGDGGSGVVIVEEYWQ